LDFWGFVFGTRPDHDSLISSPRNRFHCPAPHAFQSIPARCSPPFACLSALCCAIRFLQMLQRDIHSCLHGSDTCEAHNLHPCKQAHELLIIETPLQSTYTSNQARAILILIILLSRCLFVMPASSRISRDLDAAREAYDQVWMLLLLCCRVFTSLLQAEQSPDYARKLSMEMHQLHSEPKESGHCDIDYCLDAALQGTITLILNNIALLCVLFFTVPQAWFMVLPMPAYLLRAWWDAACAHCRREGASFLCLLPAWG
jgi:hypothetical protein